MQLTCARPLALRLEGTLCPPRRLKKSRLSVRPWYTRIGKAKLFEALQSLTCKIDLADSTSNLDTHIDTRLLVLHRPHLIVMGHLSVLHHGDLCLSKLTGR